PNNRSNIAIGGNGDGTVNSLGAGSQVVGRDNIALGTESASIVRGRSNIGIGSETGNNLDGSFNSALGFRAGSTVDGDQNVAMGFEAGQKVTANRTVSIGARSKASANDAIAIGTNAKASGSSSISIGTGNTVTGDNSGAIGDPSTITGTGSYSLGNNNTIGADNAFAIGNNVSIASGLDGAVGIGNNSTVSASTVASFVPTGATTVAGTSIGSNVVSVGNAGNERRLTNVAAGGTDTDAVNVSQLRAVDNQVTSNTSAIGNGINFNVNNKLKKTFALGEEIKFNTDPNLTTTALGSSDGISLGLADTIKVGSSPAGVTIDGTAGTVSNLSNTTFDPNNFTSGQAATEDQLSALGGSVTSLGFGIKAADGATVQKNLGEAVQIIGANDNITTQEKDGAIEVVLNKTLDLGNNGSVTTGITTLDDDGVRIIGTNNDVVLTRTGLFNGGNKIRGVTDGDVSNSSRDAINGSQLFDTNQNVVGNTTALGGSYDADTDMYTPPSYLLDDGTNSGTNAPVYNDVGSALGNLDGRTISNTANIAKGINFNVNNTLKKTFALGEEIKFNTDPNLTTTALGSSDGITLGLANTINIGAPTDNPIAINGSAGTISGLTNQSFDPSSFTSGQAATEDQLKSVSDVANAGWDITVGQNGGTTTNGGTANIGPGDRVAIDSGKNIDFLVDNTEGVPTLTVSTKDEVEFTQVTIGDTTAGGENTVITSSANGLDIGGDKLTNVGIGAIGASSTDAINGSQLFDTNQNVAGNTAVLGGSYDPNTDMYTPPSYLLDDGTNSGTNASPYNDVGSALGNLDGRTISNTANIAKGINFNVNNTLKKTFALGEEIKFNTDPNLTTTALGSSDGITLGLADTIKVGSSPAGVTIDGTAGTVSNLSNTTFDASATYTGGVAATQEQLSALSGSVTSLGFGIKAADGATVKKSLGEAIDIVGADDNITTQEKDGAIEVVLNKTLDLGNNGSVTTGNTLLNDSGVTLKGGSNQIVRLTNNGLDNGNNKISNVAAGDITAGSTEAVNGGQFHNAANALTSVMGGHTVNNGGIITTSNIGDTGKDNIHDAIKSVNTAAVQAKTTVEQGKNITVTQGTNLDGSTKYTVATADTLDVTSVKAGDTLLNTSGVSVDDGKGNSAALSAAGSTVTNAAGSTSYGAGGLTASDNAGNSTVVNQYGLSFTGSDGTTGPSVTASGIDAGSTQITNVASGGEVGTNAANINDVRTAVASSKPVMVNGTNVGPIVRTLSADGKDTYIINADGTTASAGSAAMTVTKGLKEDNNLTDYAVDLSDITKVSLVRADSAMQSLVTQIDGNDVKAVNQSSNTANFVTGDNIVLSDDNGSIKVATSDNLNVTSVTANTITTGNTTVNNNGLSIINGPSITAEQGINAGGQTVTGVADGIAPKDAVNVSQLRAVESNFGSAFNELGYRIDDVEKESRAGIAATLALESAPYVPGKFTYAVGAGFHRGENAVGASLRHTAVSGRWSLTGGVAADSEGGASVRVGVSGVIN
ncbi:YadA-like family protein, partial [Psychrobacter sp. 1U2]|uniref:YadA-like family protein n=1 Tax=Psychrobacter sp. 1U2 TaxID=3453577 RepID=UPI003F46DFB5